jgi:thermitase
LVRRIRARLSGAAVALLSGVVASALIAAPARADAGDIVVKRATDLSTAQRAGLRSDAGVRLVQTLPLPGVEVVHPDGADAAAALAALRADPSVDWAEPDRPRHATTSDPLFRLQWGLENPGGSLLGVPAVADADIDAPDAWSVTRGAGVEVAVVDTGVDAGHPDLAGRVSAGADFVDHDGSADDANGHGTHVAGTIAAAIDDVGVAGVAPEATILPLRALDGNGSGFSSDVAAAFERAAGGGARVVNASLGADTISNAERLAIRNHPRTLFVVPAGNGGSDGVGDDLEAVREFPCSLAEPNVLCVGAIGPDDTKVGFSNYGRASVDLFAPGVRIVSDYARSVPSQAPGFEVLDGTSMATAFVTGAAALLAAARPDADAAAIKAALIDGADRPPALAGLAVGGGRLNVARSLGVGVGMADAATPPPEPAPPPTDAAQSPAPTPPPAAPPAPALASPAAPPAATPAASQPRLSGVRLSRRRVRCARRCRPAVLRFDLTVAGTVTTTLERRRCRRGRCRFRRVGSTTRTLAAGRHTLRVGPRVAGVRLVPGRWRIALRTSASTAVVAFRVVR